MKIDRDEARRIADLAHLELTDEALERMAAEMTKILTYIDQLREVALDAAPPGDDAAATPMREDVPLAPLDRELAARNA
ncbi:MAG TPA: Asp-tRNA(Asn)/Glu-tRNA(Gln) amidotransferase subunit GatC, partial [Thermoanaerobaculia bacterium]|nr:Asp-tRNA(Asn)/Glu-tRNA(Gln) amidotransferase subunit GatC [Thermoanaerobaculia bacterium]